MLGCSLSTHSKQFHREIEDTSEILLMNEHVDES